MRSTRAVQKWRMWSSHGITARQQEKQRQARAKTARRHQTRAAAGARPKSGSRPRSAVNRPRSGVRAVSARSHKRKHYTGVKKYYAPVVRVLPKFMVSVGLFFIFMGVILLSIGFTKSMNYRTGRTSGPILLCLGLAGFIGGIIWIRKRSRERKRKERAELESKQLELNNRAAKYISNGSVANMDSAFTDICFVDGPSTSDGCTGSEYMGNGVTGSHPSLYAHDSESDDDDIIAADTSTHGSIVTADNQNNSANDVTQATANRKPSPVEIFQTVKADVTVAYIECDKRDIANLKRQANENVTDGHM